MSAYSHVTYLLFDSEYLPPIFLEPVASVVA